MKKTKSVICILLCALCFVTGGCARNTQSKIVGEDSGLATRLENMFELQKSIFTGEIKSVTTEDALITKYNLDITRYTVYTVNVTESHDGYTPTGEIKLYCVGTPSEFSQRISMKKNETYIIDAQPWVYGDEIIYLLSIFTNAYPTVDVAGMVTIAQSATESLSCGTYESYVKGIKTARDDYVKEHEGFFTPAETAKRLLDVFAESKDKNNDRTRYEREGLGWHPTEAFIKATADNSDLVYNAASELTTRENVTDEDIRALFTMLKR